LNFGPASAEGLVTASSKIRVGIVGASARRGFASVAHIPASRALPQFEIAAVCTTREDSAQEAARHYGVPLAFSDPEQLARHPDVDLVTVSVKVSDHYRPVMAAIAAGKHVYCEWPLGRDSEEAAHMLTAAEQRGIRHAVGLQGRMSPAINYVKDLIVEGYVGRVLQKAIPALSEAIASKVWTFRINAIPDHRGTRHSVTKGMLFSRPARSASSTRASSSSGSAR
jgi:predicted dehydrogenase